ncbi:hypothetical protein BC962_3061 [Gillisia mitskevichiae]|uniref:Outer membrane protein with beta-barrel domain n=1 Tax=Gillisia mitskevichiae TaxID=270921 RepID=A0A495NWI5_9FLAO|nr:hypothetical protein [Gillisia mitskevichiae]RKS42774.1 hypothetical protein BC962_3061 [Gillisia mitskevichiae]
MNKIKSNIVIVILIYLNSNFTLAQESKLTLNSTSIGIGLIGSSSETSDGGLSISLDLSTKLNENIFSFYLNGGSELNLFDAEENYTEINLTYGRQIELNNWIKLEGHLGVGYFNYSVKNGSTNFTTNKESTIGFPFRVKLIFYTGKHFGIGINPNMNLNSLVNTYSGNIIFQYRF